MEQKGFEFGKALDHAAEARRRRTLTVSELSERIQGVLETELLDLWVEGEVSNLSTPASGHLYFSLKDERAQIRAVIWKSDLRYIRFRPKDGMKVVVRGPLRVYAPKGEYQIQVQLLEPLGKGSLQQAFEELKEKLEQEGLFDARRKRPLPMLPRRIGVVTSPTGAVVQDILRVLGARYKGLEVLIYPARVQGEGAALEIVQGIRALSGVRALDLLIIARGGGSLEDLWPFNEEVVARALAASPVVTISAVGHETDYTIADFVADLRAPTPTAAAERIVQARDELLARVRAVTSHRVFAAERGRIHTHAQRVDGLAHRAGRGVLQHLERARAGLRRGSERLEAFRLDRQLLARRERIARSRDRLEARLRADLEARRGALLRLVGVLDSLSPLGVLARGYALVWDAAGQALLRRADDVNVGDALRVRLLEGGLRATVTSKE